jgi:hypothetical protein
MVFEINSSFSAFETAVKAFGGYGPVFYFDDTSNRYVRAFVGDRVFVHEANTSTGTITTAFPEAISIAGNIVIQI